MSTDAERQRASEVTVAIAAKLLTQPRATADTNGAILLDALLAYAAEVRAPLESERASLADVVNTCLREAHIPRQAKSADEDLRPLVEELLFALNRAIRALAEPPTEGM